MRFQLVFTATWSRADHSPPLPHFPPRKTILPNFPNYRQYSEHAEFGRFGQNLSLGISVLQDLARPSHGSLFTQEVGEDTSQGSTQTCLVPTERPLGVLQKSLQLLY